MTRSSLKYVALLGLLALAACDGGNNGGVYGGTTTPPTTTSPSPTPLEAAFGTKFATAFKASVTTDPVDVAPGDITAVSLTTDPIEPPAT